MLALTAPVAAAVPGAAAAVLAALGLSHRPGRSEPVDPVGAGRPRGGGLMCLGEIGQVSALGDGGVALIAVADVERRVLLATLDETVALGDWLVVHSGFALARLDPDEAAAALTLRATPVDPAATPPQR